MKRAHDYELRGVDVEVSEGVVLLSGNVPRQEDRIEAARIAWSAPGIAQVGNEIMGGDKQRLIRNTKDGLLEKSVRTRLAVDKYVKGSNYNIETHDGIVYLLGVARDPRELDRAARIAAMTRGTREVVSYVRLADQTVDVAAMEWSGAGPAAPPSRRQLPDFVTSEPLPPVDSVPTPAPMRQAPSGESVPYSAPGSPYALGDNTTPPVDPNAEPFYIDPSTGRQIQVRTQR
jgi:hypothetical protein